MNSSPWSRQRKDLLALVERIISHTEEAEEASVTLKTSVARYLLELAKKAPKPSGRQYLSGREKQEESLVIAQALRRKKALIADGMRPGAAERQAAKEAQQRLRHRSLAVTTILRRMQGRQ